MDQSPEEIIKNLFPGLASDQYFAVTSKKDPLYNCIAWAYRLYKDRWMQFDTTPRFDGVWYWWPKGVEVSPSINAYIEAFKSIGFCDCNKNSDFEPGFVKIALYIKDGNCTHASRQKRNGVWMSKLGQFHDIEHGTPYTIEGDNYGLVFCIMKMEI
jgi:hypothetical protein